MWRFGNLVKDIPAGNQSNTDDTLKQGTKRQRRSARSVHCHLDRTHYGQHHLTTRAVVQVGEHEPDPQCDLFDDIA